LSAVERMAEQGRPVFGMHGRSSYEPVVVPARRIRGCQRTRGRGRGAR
jgi:hypothetical protein